MAKISYPQSLKLPTMQGLTRSLIKYSQGRWELKITVDLPSGKSENMAIGFRDTDMDTLLYSLKAEGLIDDYHYPERT